MTRLVYEARENALDHIRREAEDLQADGVIGVKLFINEVGTSFVEVLAIGTAIKRNASCKTVSAAARAAGHHPRPRHLLRPRPPAGGAVAGEEVSDLEFSGDIEDLISPIL